MNAKAFQFHKRIIWGKRLLAQIASDKVLLIAINAIHLCEDADHPNGLSEELSTMIEHKKRIKINMQPYFKTFLFFLHIFK